VKSGSEQFPILSLIGRQDQEVLLLRFRPKAVAPDKGVIRRGTHADGMDFISTGAVGVLVNGRTWPRWPSSGVKMNLASREDKRVTEKDQQVVDNGG